LTKSTKIDSKGMKSVTTVRSGVTTPQVKMSVTPIVGTSPKILFIIIVYMFLLISVTSAFQNSYVDFTTDSFEVENSGVMGMPNDFYGHSYDRTTVRAVYSLVYDYGYNQTEYEALASWQLVDVLEDVYGGNPDVTYFSRFLLWEWENLPESFVGIAEYPFIDVVVMPSFYLTYPDGQQLYDVDYLAFIGGEANVEDFDEEEGWWSAVEKFFGSIGETFNFIIKFMSFDFVADADESLDYPAELRWIPFMMAVPVWIYIGLLVAPYAIEALKAIAGFIDAVVPF